MVLVGETGTVDTMVVEGETGEVDTGVEVGDTGDIKDVVENIDVVVETGTVGDGPSVLVTSAVIEFISTSMFPNSPLFTLVVMASTTPLAVTGEEALSSISAVKVTITLPLLNVMAVSLGFLFG